MPRPTSRATRDRVALTGTPGSGKSRVARELDPIWNAIEVGILAVDRGLGRRTGDAVRVDLDRLRRSLVARPLRSPTVVVGHLAHLLPVDRAIVLRCHPLVLRSRLRAARRGTPAERQDNYVAEAVDLVVREARDRGLRVWEVDTTRRSPRSVAREVERILRDPSRPPGRRADWLGDPRVTAHLLDRPS